MMPMLLLGLMSGCATEVKSLYTVINTECSDFKPIYPSHQDVLTRGTQDQILVHDEMYDRRCPTVKEVTK